VSRRRPVYKAYGVRISNRVLAFQIASRVLPRSHVQYTVVSGRDGSELLEGLVTGSRVQGYILRYGSILVRVWYDNRRKMLLVASASPGAEELCKTIAERIEEELGRVVRVAGGGRQVSR